MAKHVRAPSKEVKKRSAFQRVSISKPPVYLNPRTNDLSVVMKGEDSLETQAEALRHMSSSQRQVETIRLEHLLGNRYVQRLLKLAAPPAQVMRYDITLERAGNAWSEASLASLCSQLMTWGVDSNQLGDLTALNQLSGEQIKAGMATIERLRTMGGLGGEAAKGKYPSRVIAAWNQHKDDLGPSKLYPTIVHFVVELNWLAHTSLGTDYLQAIKMMKKVRLAGVEFSVHPRAIYFVAAAQAEMDVAAEVEEGQGHYIAPGAYVWELAQIQKRLKQFASKPKRNRSGEVVGAQQKEVEAIGVQAFNVLRGQVLDMIDVMEVQSGKKTIEGVSAEEHREPGLQDYLLSKAGALRGVPDAASADDARRLAGQMSSILGTVPIGKAAHGFGSVDPHGTDHAIGLAADLFNGRGAAGVIENFGLKKEYLPFLYRLIDEHGSPELKKEHPTGIQQLSPELARELAKLLIDFGSDVVEEMMVSSKEPAAVKRQRKTELSGYQQIANRILSGYYQRWQLLTLQLSRKAWFKYASEVRNLATSLRDSLKIERRAFMLQAPRQVLAELQARTAQMEELYKQAVSANQTATSEEEAELTNTPAGRLRKRSRQANLKALEPLRPEFGRGGVTLASQQKSLEGSLDKYADVFEKERAAIVGETVRKPGFKSWITRASNPDFPIYDQPSIVVNALNNVIGHRSQAGKTEVRQRTRFLGAHHWQMLEREAITNAARYREILELDMRQPRRKGMISRVLSIMAENPGGKEALTGSDPDFLAALKTVYGDPSAMIKQALGSTEKKPAGKSTSLLEFLRQRGYHYLAGDEEKAED
jgi:hypothetical protein